nr:MAG TPA: hypothetical protein [Caudoviricetes sp.]
MSVELLEELMLDPIVQSVDIILVVFMILKSIKTEKRKKKVIRII